MTEFFNDMVDDICANVSKYLFYVLLVLLLFFCWRVMAQKGIKRHHQIPISIEIWHPNKYSNIQSSLG